MLLKDLSFRNHFDQLYGEDDWRSITNSDAVPENTPWIASPGAC